LTARLEHPAKLAARAAWHRSHGHTDTAETFERVLAAAHRCRMCGRELTDPESIERGVGPDCLAKEGLP
jgi:hypothetical protein